MNKDEFFEVNELRKFSVRLMNYKKKLGKLMNKEEFFGINELREFLRLLN